MNWLEDIVKRCKKFNAEIAKDPNGNMIIICPKEMSRANRASIRKMVPQTTECTFIESIKPSTTDSLNMLLKGLVVMGSIHPSLADKDLTLYIQGQTREEFDWGSLDNLLHEDGFLDKWSVQVNGEDIHTRSRRQVEAFQRVSENMIKNADRSCITDDDILNMRIALENAQSVEDFINSI